MERMGYRPDLRSQLFWARSQHLRDPMDRLVLYEIVALADGRKQVSCTSALLSGLAHISSARAEHVLARLENRGFLRRFCGAGSNPLIELAYPPASNPSGAVCAHVRESGGV